MATRCWLHIGAPKTGSTALQQFLSANDGRLKSLGWLYPAAARRAGGHHDLAFLTGGGYPDWATPQDKSLAQMEDELRIEITASPASVLLSSEDFYLLGAPADVAGMLERLGFRPETVTVLVYLRRQDEAYVSWYNQAVKAQGYAGTFSDMLPTQRELWDYSTRLRAWADVFGASRILVRPYARSDLMGEDVCRDLIGTLGLPQHVFDFPVERVNTGLNRDLLEFQRLVNRLPLSPQDKRRFHRQLIALTAASKDSSLFDDQPLLDASMRNQILGWHAAGNREVAGTYLGRERLFDDPLPGREEHRQSEGLTVDKLGSILGWLLATQEAPPQRRTP